MGQPVVHFEVIGEDGEKLRGYYSDLFGWEINADNPMGYGVVDREGNVNSDGVGIGGGVGNGPAGYDGHVTFYVEVPDVEDAQLEQRAEGPPRGGHSDLTSPQRLFPFLNRPLLLPGLPATAFTDDES
jgi:predicted enzyme related to lactoylglutathione lyase